MVTLLIWYLKYSLGRYREMQTNLTFQDIHLMNKCEINAYAVKPLMQPVLLFGQAFYCRIQTLCLVSVLILLNESMFFVWKSKNLRRTSWFGRLAAGCMMKWRAENNNGDLWHRLYLIFLILATLESSKARGVCVCLCLSPCVCMPVGMGSDSAQLPNHNGKNWLARHY